MADTSATRAETFPAGIAGVGLGTVERQIPAGEPPPLPPNAELSVIGKPYPRLNGRAKVTGAIRYTVDVAPPKMLIGRILRSPHAHAEVRAIDVSAAERDPRVRAIIRAIPLERPGARRGALCRTARRRDRGDLDGCGRRGARPHSRRLQAFAFRRRSGRGAVVPKSPKVYDAVSAPGASAGEIVAQAGLPLDGNVRGPAEARRGDVAQGFAGADVILEGEYRTQVQTHCCMEPHGLVADWRPDGLTVHMSTQYTAGVRRELASAFNLPLEKVRVVVDGMGGGFGSKSTLGNYGRLAVALSRQAERPGAAHAHPPRGADGLGNRPATRQRIRIGARRDGSLTAISVESHGTAGVGLNAGIGNFAQALYACPNFESAQYDVFTNAGPGNRDARARAIRRAHGAWRWRSTSSPSAWASIRSRSGSASIRAPCGGRNGASARRRSAGRGGMRRAPIPARSSAAWAWPSRSGARMCRPPHSIEVRIHRDGTVEALSGVQDIGSGIGVVIAQTIAEALGPAPEAITVRIGDTALSAGAALLWQPDDRLDHAARARRDVQAPAAIAQRSGARAQRARR